MKAKMPQGGVRRSIGEIAPPPPPLFKRRRGSRPIGPFGYLVMQSIEDLKERAFGMAIDEDLTNKLRAIIDLAQIYVTLKRLTQRGFLTKEARPAPDGTGQTVHVYSITKEGAEAMVSAGAFYKHLLPRQPQKGDARHGQTQEASIHRRRSPPLRQRSRQGGGRHR